MAGEVAGFVPSGPTWYVVWGAEVTYVVGGATTVVAGTVYVVCDKVTTEGGTTYVVPGRVYVVAGFVPFSASAVDVAVGGATAVVVRVQGQLVIVIVCYGSC